MKKNRGERLIGFFLMGLLCGLFCGLLLPALFSHYFYKKANRDLEKRLERYRKMI